MRAVECVCGAKYEYSDADVVAMYVKRKPNGAYRKKYVVVCVECGFRIIVKHRNRANKVVD